MIEPLNVFTAAAPGGLCLGGSRLAEPNRLGDSRPRDRRARFDR